MKDPANNPLDDFDEYLRQSEPQRRERAESWKTAIGLQAVDGLKPSEYLVETAKRHIEGDISMEEVRHLIDSYYQGKAARTTVQVAHKRRTSSSQVSDKSAINHPNLLLLVQAVGEASLSVTEMLPTLHLQHRGNFLKTWLNPALQAGVLRPLYPDTPRHPRQKYLLTPQGQEMYQQIKTSKRT